MDQGPGPPERSDPSALTQPIPVVPSFTSSRPVVATAPYAHQFGSLPFYVFARFAAVAVDFLVVAFVIAAFEFHAFDAGFLMLAGRNEAGFEALAGIALGGALLFAFLCEALFGTTLGKLLFALQVRRTDGGHAGVLRVLVRALLRPVDLLLVGLLLALVTPRRQRLGDLAAGTVVARSRIGAFASLIGVILLACLGYAQVAFGGGITSAIGVTAESANFGPVLFDHARSAFGFERAAPAQPLAQPTEEPSPQPEASGVT